MNEAPDAAPLQNCDGVKKFLLWFRNHAGQEKPLCGQEKSLSASNLISSCTRDGRDFA
jgi:hypothetical protein